MKPNLTWETWRAGRQRGAPVDDLDLLPDDDLPTPIDTNAMRWVVIATVGFWMLVSFAARHIF